MQNHVTEPECTPYAKMRWALCSPHLWQGTEWPPQWRAADALALPNQCHQHKRNRGAFLLFFLAANPAVTVSSVVPLCWHPNTVLSSLAVFIYFGKNYSTSRSFTYSLYQFIFSFLVFILSVSLCVPPTKVENESWKVGYRNFHRELLADEWDPQKAKPFFYVLASSIST